MTETITIPVWSLFLATIGSGYLTTLLIKLNIWLDERQKRRLAPDPRLKSSIERISASFVTPLLPPESEDLTRLRAALAEIRFKEDYPELSEPLKPMPVHDFATPTTENVAPLRSFQIIRSTRSVPETVSAETWEIRDGRVCFFDRKGTVFYSIPSGDAYAITPVD